MLENRIRTPEERAAYLADLKKWLGEVREAPLEGMSDFFSDRVGIYEDVHLKHWPREYAAIADYFDESLTSLLDIGCGTGLELDSIFRRFPDVKVTGIDLSETMLNRLREKFYDRKPTLICGDYFTVPLEEGRYDAALSFETLHHFPYRKKLTLYKKLRAAIKEGGYYLECDYAACCREEESLCLENGIYRRKKWGIPADAFVHIDIPLTPEHQTELLEKAGFRRVEILYENGSTVILRADK